LAARHGGITCHLDASCIFCDNVDLSLDALA
jgi:hypothetical protein